MSIETNPIVSGQTMLVPEALPKWIYDEKVILSDCSATRFMEMDDLLTRPLLHEFLSELKPVPFYRYMVRYLLARYPALCPNDPETLVKAVYAEIETGGKSKKLQNRLRDEALQTFAANGFGAADEQVRGSLTDPHVYWKPSRLREVLLGESIEEEKFFLLALGLGMDIEDVTVFLQKVLLRRPLDPFVPMEGLLQVCLQAECADRYGLFRHLWDTYKICAQRVQIEEERASRREKTVTDRAVAKANLWALQQKCAGSLAETLSVTEEMQDYVRTVELVDWTKLPEKQAFDQQIKKIKKAFAQMDKQETRQYSVLPEGAIRVYYTPNSALEIPAGTEFCDAAGRVIAESVKTVSTADFAAGREISFEVFSKMPLYEKFQAVEKHQVFRCGLPGCEALRLKNKSRIKKIDVEQPDEPLYLRATLTGTVVGDVAFPRGTEFWCSVCKDRKKCGKTGQCEHCEDAASCPNCKRIVMINREPLSFCYLEVPVQAREPEAGEAWPEAISRNAIVSANLREEARAQITGIEHPRLTARQRADQNASLFMEYFYGPRDIGDCVDEGADLPLEAYPRLLGPVLRGMRLSDARISELKTKGYPAVKRHELLTAVFLQRAMTYYKAVPEELLQEKELPEHLPQDGLDQGFDLRREADRVLQEAGFYGIYLPNPYDSLLAYLSTCLYPADVYRRLWGMLRWAKQKEDVVL